MKKIIAFLFVFCVSCSTAAPLIIDSSSAQKKYSVSVGSNIELRLDVQMGTGYSWIVASSEGFTTIGKPTLVSEPVKEPKTGEKETLVFVFKAEKTGDREIVLEYKQPWEKDKAPEKTMKLMFEIK
ncbi:MAG TPA: protease inhibitor I42 family protein [Spirochaetota bacterium]